VIALADEKMEGEPLLVKVMENGKITYNLPSIGEIRAAASESLSKLPEKYKKLTNASTYPVELSQALEDLIKRLRRKLTKTEILNPP
jgi:nicotinate phosphoribosyltransferase